LGAVAAAVMTAIRTAAPIAFSGELDTGSPQKTR